MGSYPDAVPVSHLAGRYDDAFYTGHAGSHRSDVTQPCPGGRRPICDAGTIVLVDCAAVLYPTWDFCTQTERFLFCVHKFADGTLYTPNERFVRVMLLPPFDRFELPVERSAGRFMDDTGWYRRPCFYHDRIACSKFCLLSRYERLAANCF